MKLLSKSLFIAILASSIVIVGCKKDDDEEKKDVLKNEFTFKQKSYTLAEAKMEVYEPWYADSTGFGATLFIGSDDANLNSMVNTAVCDILELNFYTTEEGKIAAGTYVYEAELEGVPFTFDEGYVYADYDAFMEEGTMEEIVSGTVEVAVSGTIYELTISLVTEEGNAVTGYYKGEIGNLNDFSWISW